MKSMKSALRSTRAPARAAHNRDLESVTIPPYAGTFEGFRRWTHANGFPAEARISFSDGEIVVELPPDLERVAIPATAHTLDGFRRWTNSKVFPQRGQIFYLNGEIYIDLSPERIETHNYIKTEITRVLATLVLEHDSGRFYSDRARLIQRLANVSNEPDAFFAYWSTLKSNKLRIIPSSTKHGDGVDIEGTPDWVLEIVSPYSEKKDTRTLRERYFKAGIPEYWLIDARSKLSFQILLRDGEGYVTQKREGGWLRSLIFDCFFRLERSRDRLGQWQYRLHVKPS